MENPSGKNEFPIILKKLVGKFIRERSISGDLIKFQMCVQKLCDKNWLNYFGRISLTVSSLLLWCGRLGGMETWREGAMEPVCDVMVKADASNRTICKPCTIEHK